MSELNFPLSESLLPDWTEEQAQESGLRKLKKPLGQRRRLGIGTGVFTSSRVSNRKAQPGPRLQRILGVREEVWSRWLLRSIYDMKLVRRLSVMRGVGPGEEERGEDQPKRSMYASAIKKQRAAG